MDQRKLHQILPGASIAKKKAKSKQSSKKEATLLTTLRMWEDKVHTLTQVQKYIEKGEEQELEDLVAYWRSLCQDLTLALNQYCQDDNHQYYTMNTSWGYNTTEDEGYERDVSSNGFDCDEPEDVIQEEETDDISRVLSHLRIDPLLIHYSPDQGFYD